MNSSSKSKERGIGCFIWLLVPITIFLFYAAHTSYQELRTFQREGKVTQATISDKQKRCSRSCSYYISYDYSVGDRLYHSESETLHVKKLYDAHPIGETLEVYYLPDKPQSSLVVGNNRNHPDLMWGGLLCLGVFFAGLSLTSIPEKWQYAPAGKLMVGLRLAALSSLGLCFAAVPMLHHTEPMNMYIWITALGAGAYMIYLVNQSVSMLKNIRAIIYRRPVDISQERRPAPAVAEAELTRLGFTRLGESVVTDLETERNRGVEWRFTNHDGTIIAVAIENQGAVEFYAWFGDDATVETSYPFGEWIDEPTYCNRFTRESIQAAYDLHLDAMQPFIATYGQPNRIQNMERVLYWDAFWRTHYNLRKHRRLITVSVLKMVFALALFLFTLIYAIGYNRLDQNVLWAYLIGGFVVIYILNWLPGLFLTYRRRAEGGV